MRALACALVAAVAFAEAAAARQIAYYLLIVCVPVVFAAGVALYGEFAAGDAAAEDLALMRLALFALTLVLLLVAATLAPLALLASFGAAAALALASALALGERMPARVLVVLRGAR